MWAREFNLRHDHKPEVLLQAGDGWYREPHHRFDVGFIEVRSAESPCDSASGIMIEGGSSRQENIQGGKSR
jgi:hypothetical protein